MSTQLSNREWIVNSLVQYQMEQIRDGRYGLWLLQMLEMGFEGFGNMSDEQLRAELVKRGLQDTTETPGALVDDEYCDADFDDDADLQVSLKAMAVGDRWAD